MRRVRKRGLLDKRFKRGGGESFVVIFLLFWDLRGVMGSLGLNLRGGSE